MRNPDHLVAQTAREPSTFMVPTCKCKRVAQEVA